MAPGWLIVHLGWGVACGLRAPGLACGACSRSCIGFLALRTTGVAFMIVTMMFAQVFYLADPLFRRLDARRRRLVSCSPRSAPSSFAGLDLDP